MAKKIRFVKLNLVCFKELCREWFNNKKNNNKVQQQF